jgi:hypothetical protein
VVAVVVPEMALRLGKMAVLAVGLALLLLPEEQGTHLLFLHRKVAMVGQEQILLLIMAAAEVVELVLLAVMELHQLVVLVALEPHHLFLGHR